MSTCTHCDRTIVLVDGSWIDPEATGDDSIWREVCDSHDTFVANHEPTTWHDGEARTYDIVTTYVRGHKVTVCLNDESHTSNPAHYWDIDNKRGVHDGHWYDGWAGSVEQAKADAIEAVRSIES